MYADILEVVKRYRSEGRVTRISYGANMPIDRLKPLLADLATAGLVVVEAGEEVRYRITPRGQEFLNAYWHVKGFFAVLDEAERSSGQP